MKRIPMSKQASPLLFSVSSALLPHQPLHNPANYHLTWKCIMQDDATGAMREAHLLSTLNHPNVLGYKESFLHDNALCIVTHFCEEGDLFNLIR